MTKTLTLITSVLITINVRADCGGNNISVFPKEYKINKNSIFFIEGYARSQEIILGLNKKYPIYLKSYNQKVLLTVKELFTGQFDLTQAYLIPNGELKNGEVYEMIIDSLPESESLSRFDEFTKKHENITYEVTNKVDKTAPCFLSKPKVKDNLIVHFGCGPAEYVYFNNQTLDESEIIIKTTVRCLETGKEITYCIQPNKEKIEVGHGMCSGAFLFENESKYEIQFDLIDASGNIKEWTGKRIRFSKPTKCPQSDYDKWLTKQRKKESRKNKS